MSGMMGMPPQMFGGGMPGAGMPGGGMPGAQMPQQPPMGGGQAPGGPAPGGSGGMPPQLLQMLMQAQQNQATPSPSGNAMPPAAGAMPPTGGPPGGVMPGGPPSAAPMPGAMPQGPGQAPLQGTAAPQQMLQGAAKQGRFGDKILAHMAPGEISIPPEMQNPQLMQYLSKQFQQLGLTPAQFTAGSPQAIRNPITGLQENSLLGALLPILGAVGGSFIAPGIGTAIGGGLGGAAAGMIDKEGTAGTLASAAGGALGGYLGAPEAAGLGDAAGAMGAGAAAAGDSAWGAAGSAAADPLASGAGSASAGWGMGPAASAPFTSAGSGGVFGSGVSGSGLMKAGFGAGLGSALGGMLAPPPTDPNASLPPGFNNKMPPLNPNFNSLLGNGQASAFGGAGYNPYAAATGQPYNFYGSNQ